MSFKMIHENYNVSDLDRSIKFYGDALDLHEVRRKTTDDFIIVYLSNDSSDFELELTWLKEHPQPYDLGECEFHLAFKADDFDSAHKKHEEMGCICFENPEMGIYFIEDPDGYWLEILPQHRINPKSVGESKSPTLFASIYSGLYGKPVARLLLQF